MNNTRIILAITLFVMGIFTSIPVFAIQSGSHASFLSGNQCSGAEVDADYYISGNSLAFYPRDNFSNSKLSFILAADSKVSLWQSKPGAVTGCDWYRVSNVAPGDKKWYVAVGSNGCQLNKLANHNPETPFAQIVYNIAYKEEQGKSTGTSNYFFYERLANGVTGPETKLADQTTRVWGAAQEHANECFNIYAAWCGDGKKNGPEVCDPNDLSQTGWGPGGCTATCQPNNVVAPKCENLTYTRNNNVYNFSCKSDKAGATKYELYVNGSSAGVNATGTFNAVTLAPTDTVECRVDNEAANLVSNNCKYSNIGSELACTTLTASPNAGVGIKTFTSVGVGVGMGGKHDLFKNNVIIATENASIISQNTQTFANITTVDKDSFRNYVENSRGNRATSDTCTFTASVGTPCVRGNITLPLSARITATTPGLCPAGQTVDNFTETFAGTVYNYTWGCNGSAVGGQCAATFDSVISNASCFLLRYSRNNNDFTFSCSGLGNVSSYTLFQGPNIIATNSTGIFTTSLSNSNNDNIYCRVNGETSTVPDCSIENVSTRLACSALAVDIPTGSGSKIFTSTATVANGAVVTRHQLTRAADIVGDSGNQVNNPLTWTFSGIIAQENNQFRSRIFDSFGNSATADSCLRTISAVGAPVCGTAARTFASTDTGYGAFQFCATGTPNPVNPAFPAAGASVSWTCNGQAGSSVTCTASRSGGPSSGGSPSCTSLTATPSTSTNGILNTTLACQQSGSSNLIIRVFNSLGTIISSGTLSTLNITGLGNGNYRAECQVANEPVKTACTVTLTVTTSSSSSGGGGGGYCGNGRLDYSETCDYTALPGTVGYHPNCRNTCNYCGDGRLDVPLEQCDMNQSWCSSSCSIDSTWPGGSSSGGGTIPGGGEIEFFPSGSLLIGNKMSVFGNTNPLTNKAYIKNNAPGDIYIPNRLCIKQKDPNKVLDSTGYDVCSTGPIGRLNKNQKFEIKLNPNLIKGTTQNLGGSSFGDAQIITKVEGVSDASFLNGFLNVRVAKPSINTAGGGAGLIKGTNISDVSKLSGTVSMPFGPLDPTLNKNLILTSLGIDPLSSNVSKQNSSLLSINKAKTAENKTVDALNAPKAGTPKTKLDKLPIQKYNGLDNVFIHNGDLDLQVPIITKDSTYIIEGDLKINKDITTGFNVLFVVKGNIEIAEDVEKINAILMAKTISSEPSTTQLTFNGALYGNIDNLLENRTYIKDREQYVDVGTNVNFSSKVFTSPPPLLSKFLAEFVSGGKIAQ